MGQESRGVLPVLEDFFRHEREQPDRIYLVQPLAEGRKQELSWAEVGDQVRRFAGWLLQQQLPPRSNIVIISKNCAHWIIADLAIWMAGHVSVPLQPTLSTHALRQMVEHAEARLVILGKLDRWQQTCDAMPCDLPKVGLPLGEADD